MAEASTQHTQMDMEFGLIFFASSFADVSQTSLLQNGDKYGLIVESAKFADCHGFSSIWIPERHFTRDGWLYPNPAVLAAALARETQHIQLRAGSVVLPLHNPIRVAEEWAMVDNLSGGRVGLSFASGWHPNDFALFPEHYADRNEEMYRGIQTVQKLWRGEPLQVKGGDGNLVEIQTYPIPLQPVLPIWITAAGNPKTFMRAGEIGANLLTHLYNHGIEELAERIQIYREARERHGYAPEEGQVSVMLHTFVWKSIDDTLELAKATFCEYLKSAAYLLNAIAFSRGQKVDFATLSEQDTRDYLDFVFSRLISTQRVLFGTPETCLEVVKRLKAIGVTEIACQMDFGLDIDLVLQSLHYVNQLKELRWREGTAQPSYSPPLIAKTDTLQEDHSNGAHPSQDSSSAAPQHQFPGLMRPTNPLQDIQARCREEVSLSQFYNRLESHGIQLAVSFQGIEQLWRGNGEALGRIQIPPTLEQEIDAYQIHPALLDACFQVLIATLPAAAGSNQEALYLPTGLRSFRVHHRPGKNAWSYAVLRSNTSQDAEVLEGDVHLLDEEGQLLVEASRLRLQRSEPAKSASQLANLIDQFCYEMQWEARSLEQVVPSSPDQPGQWLIFMDSSGVGQKVADQLTAVGHTCVKIFPGYTYHVIQQRAQYSINPADPEQMQRVINDVFSSQNPSGRGVLHLWNLDATSSEEISSAKLETDQALGVVSALSLIQALVNMPGTPQPRLWFVTQGAQAVSQTASKAVSDISTLSVTQSPVWGLGKTCAIEHPELWGGLVDVEQGEKVDTIAAQLLAVISHRQSENQIAFRQGQSYVARLIRSKQWHRQELAFRPDASYLITGGLWGLGFEVARWFAKKGAQNLVLLGRTQLPPRSEWKALPPDSRLARQVAGIQELEELGVHVYYAAVDVADEQQLASFLYSLREQHYPPICGILHAASVWQDQQGQSLVRPLIHLDQEAVQAVFRPKVAGSWHLYKLFQESKLDFFVLFSSGASLLGSAAQGNYAAAGAFLDALAHYVRAKGQPALSIDWGAVSGTGFGATQEGLRVHEYWESHGIQRITPQQVLDALELLIPQDVSQVGVLKLDWQELQQFYPQLAKLPLFAYLAPQAANNETSAAPSVLQTDSTALPKNALLQKLAAADQEERQQLMEFYLSEKVANVLRLPLSRIDVQQPLTMLGLDSLMAIELKNKIELELSIHIPIITFLQGPSIQQFAAQLLAQLVEIPPPSPPPPTLITEQTGAPEEVDSTQDAGTTLETVPQAPELIVQTEEKPLPAQRGPSASDQVDSLPGSVLQAGNGRAQATHGMSQQEVSQLLASIDQLSDGEVESLLHHIVQEEGLNQ